MRDNCRRTFRSSEKRREEKGINLKYRLKWYLLESFYSSNSVLKFQLDVTDWWHFFHWLLLPFSFCFSLSCHAIIINHVKVFSFSFNILQLFATRQWWFRSVVRFLSASVFTNILLRKHRSAYRMMYCRCFIHYAFAFVGKQLMPKYAGETRITMFWYGVEKSTSSVRYFKKEFCMLMCKFKIATQYVANATLVAKYREFHIRNFFTLTRTLAVFLYLIARNNLKINSNCRILYKTSVVFRRFNAVCPVKLNQRYLQRVFNCSIIIYQSN